nr:hypothetical protein Iba_chr07cCG7060 [Ipomoea batatas]
MPRTFASRLFSPSPLATAVRRPPVLDAAMELVRQSSGRGSIIKTWTAFFSLPTALLSRDSSSLVRCPYTYSYVLKLSDLCNRSVVYSFARFDFRYKLVMNKGFKHIGPDPVNS